MKALIRIEEGDELLVKTTITKLLFLMRTSGLRPCDIRIDGDMMLVTPADGPSKGFDFYQDLEGVKLRKKKPATANGNGEHLDSPLKVTPPKEKAGYHRSNTRRDQKTKVYFEKCPICGKARKFGSGESLCRWQSALPPHFKAINLATAKEVVCSHCRRAQNGNGGKTDKKKLATVN